MTEQEWLSATDEERNAHYEKCKELYEKLYQLAHTDSMNPSAVHAIKMIQAGYDNERIIMELVLLGGTIFKKFNKAVALMNPNYSHLLNEE